MSLALPSRRLTRAAVTLKPIPQTQAATTHRGPAPRTPTRRPRALLHIRIPQRQAPLPAPTDPSTPAPPASRALRRDPTAMAAALDPNPRARKRWLRKMTIRSIRGRGRLNKTVKILRTERSHLAKSHFLKTSVKKLGPLARQIAGKPIEDAIVQMRFSPKKAAREVKRHLEYARDEAVVRRGMGLGAVDGKGAVEGGEVVVEDKKGKRRVVRDKTEIYVDQAWVGRGSYERERDYRARGQVNIMMCPYTSISVLLKEEATRIRLAEEREQKRQKKKVWVPLPDRPVTAQRQYCLW
ncbi:MAG: 54S ribosomal mitochondrial [Lasallia pustulata]|uniref:54S ribosomal mitochondrial n=1 Tax=Lasallia pustulata TaxID=136370 RepID=A0A5M8PRK6_9LECA|nr:MAG: 54S ribosomal mitochondrial [Lasallia pustulata]